MSNKTKRKRLPIRGSARNLLNLRFNVLKHRSRRRRRRRRRSQDASVSLRVGPLWSALVSKSPNKMSSDRSGRDVTHRVYITSRWRSKGTVGSGTTPVGPQDKRETIPGTGYRPRRASSIEDKPSPRNSRTYTPHGHENERTFQAGRLFRRCLARYPFGTVDSTGRS